jgi:hypothetical protein
MGMLAKKYSTSSGPRLPSVGRRLRTTVRNLRISLALGLIRLAFSLARSGKRQYEPVEIGGRRFRNRRDSQARLEAVLTVLREHRAHTLLDVGCAEGWFVRRAASDCQCFAIGIEASERVLVGELARLHDGVEGMAIVKARVSAADIRALPKFDAVICMSVLHHIIRTTGLPSAEDFVRALASRTQKVLIFEMGTADEHSWKDVLPEVAQGQEEFVRALLERCGLRNVCRIAESPAFHRETQRLLFTAEPVNR